VALDVPFMPAAQVWTPSDRLTVQVVRKSAHQRQCGAHARSRPGPLFRPSPPTLEGFVFQLRAARLRSCPAAPRELRGQSAVLAPLAALARSLLSGATLGCRPRKLVFRKRHSDVTDQSGRRELHANVATKLLLHGSLD
jgi:hypothetical protein